MSLWDEGGPADDALLSGDVYGDYLFVRKATDFIASHAAADATSSATGDATGDARGSASKPLFLYLALQCSHQPFQAPAELLPEKTALRRAGVATSENTLAQVPRASRSHTRQHTPFPRPDLSRAARGSRLNASSHAHHIASAKSKHAPERPCTLTARVRRCSRSSPCLP